MIDSVQMSLSLPQEKLEFFLSQCKNLISKNQITLLDLTKLIFLLSSTAQAVLPAHLNHMYLQYQQIQALRKNYSYQQKIQLNQESREELQWWIENLKLCNGKGLILPFQDMFLTTDASKKGWGASCQEQRTGGPWSREEQDLDIQMLELKAVQLAILTFTKLIKPKCIHIQMDNTSALCYLAKMGGTQNKMMFKEIWSYLLTYNIMITVEYLPSKLNVVADWESRNYRDSSEWKLSPRVFTLICQKWGTPDVDLFASRLSHKVPGYMAWKPDPGSRATDALEQNWKNLFPYAFPPFSLIGRVLIKVRKEKARLILVTPLWQAQPWYATLLQMSIKDPVQRFVKTPIRSNTSSSNKQISSVRGLDGFREHLAAEGMQTLYQTVGEQEQRLLTNRPGISGLAGVINKKLILLNVL